MGFGFGMIYMLPIRNAWLFYPDRKGMVSGIILSSYSVGAIVWSFLSTYLANPNNDHTTILIQNGISHEKLFDPDSEVALNTPEMLRVLSYIFLAMALLSTLLITKKTDETKKYKQVMYIGGDYFTDATVTPILTPNRTPGVTSPQNPQRDSPNFTPGNLSPMIEEFDSPKQFQKSPSIEKEKMLKDSIIFAQKLNEKMKSVKNNRHSLRALNLKQTLKHRTFWHIFIMLMFSMSFSYFMKPALKNYGSTKFNDDAFLT